jgi:hypothetical protein
MSAIIDWILKFNNKLVLSMLISWFATNVTEPLKEILFVGIEDAGYYWVHECRKIPFRELPRYIRDAQAELLPYKNLPDTDIVWRYSQEDNVPYVDFMAFGWKYLYEQQVGLAWDWQKAEYSRKYIEVSRRIKMYDLMDDMKRPYVYLYRKRIKLMELKEQLGADNYDKLVLPPVVPVEYVSKPDK